MSACAVCHGTGEVRWTNRHTGPKRGTCGACYGTGDQNYKPPEPPDPFALVRQNERVRAIVILSEMISAEGDMSQVQLNQEFLMEFKLRITGSVKF